MMICVDIDNVLNNLTEEALKLYNSRTNKDIQMIDITTYNFYDCLPKEDAEGITALFKEKELWDSLKPLQGSQNAIKELIRKEHKVYLATATDACNFAWKMEWLKHFYPFIPEENVIRIMDKSLLRCDVMIEDNIETLTNVFADRVVLDYPWNRSSSKDFAYDIRRAKSWTDIVNIINQIEREMEEWEK